MLKDRLKAKSSDLDAYLEELVETSLEGRILQLRMSNEDAEEIDQAAVGSQKLRRATSSSLGGRGLVGDLFLDEVEMPDVGDGDKDGDRP